MLHGVALANLRQQTARQGYEVKPECTKRYSHYSTRMRAAVALQSGLEPDLQECFQTILWYVRAWPIAKGFTSIQTNS